MIPSVFIREKNQKDSEYMADYGINCAIWKGAGELYNTMRMFHYLQLEESQVS